MQQTAAAGTVVHCAGCIVCLDSKVDRRTGETRIRESSLNLKHKTWRKEFCLNCRAVSVHFGYGYNDS